MSSRQTGALERKDPSKPVKESEQISLRPKESEQMSKISLQPAKESLKSSSTPKEPEPKKSKRSQKNSEKKTDQPS